MVVPILDWDRQLAPMCEASDIARRLYGGSRSVGSNVDVAIRYRSIESRGIHPYSIPTTQRNGPDWLSWQSEHDLLRGQERILWTR
ncbi:MAG: hypothetical protein ABSG81_11520 [Acidimicrobiales bacterium]